MSSHRHPSLIDEFPGPGQLQNLTHSADVRGGSPGPLRKGEGSMMRLMAQAGGLSMLIDN